MRWITAFHLPTLLATAVIAVTPHSAKHHKYHPTNPGCHTRKCDHRVGVAQWKKKRKKELAEGWAIPAYIVECESHFTNERTHIYSTRPLIDPSGYYQIISETWREHGGTRYAPEAWEATKEQQGIIARKIVVSGGLSEWQCA